MEEKLQQLACLIATGGTYGHVAPALAIAEVLSGRGVRVTFAGSPDRVEARLVPEAGFEFDAFRIQGLPRRPSLAQARAVLLAGRAPLTCRGILARRRPDVVLGGGGYVSAPMVWAAWAARIPAALTEADAHLGLANRIAAPFSRRVFLALPIEGRTGPKYRVSGRPVPRASLARPQDGARRLFGLPPEGPVLLVFGGSQGARSLNELAVAEFGRAGPAVLHLSGERDFEALGDRVRRPDYRLLPFVEDFGSAVGASDLVLARAGGSIWEIAAAGKPAVLVPYPSATGDHQTKNAQHFVRAGGAVSFPERDLAHVPIAVRALLADPVRREAMGVAMRAAARPGAAREIAEELIRLAGA